MIIINKDIRRIRTENYFIEALCDIIRKDGMGSATIRNVADKAGYNSATIYTYFENFSHLLLKTHFRFELELLKKIKEDTKIETVDKVCTIWSDAYISMADFYLKNPNIFECIFVSKYEEAKPEELRTSHEQESDFMQFMNLCLEKISIETKSSIQTIKQINETCLALVVGTILLQVKQRFNEPHENILVNLKIQLNHLINSNLQTEKDV